MTMSKVKVTPEMAQEWLKNNKNNRNLSKYRVMRYAQDMKKGAWKSDTFEFVKISKSGNVLDGQHRLHAIVKANIPIVLHVVFDVPEEVHDVLDTGKTRSASDVFKIEGVKNSNSIPSMMQMYYLLKNSKSVGTSMVNSKKTNAELLDAYYENHVFWQSVGRKSYNWYTSFGKVLQTSHIGGLYAFFSDEVDQDLAEKFMHELCSGFDISNEVISQLRQKLITDRISVKRMPVTVKLALIAKAFKYYKNNKTPKLLKFSLEKETFPSLK